MEPLMFKIIITFGCLMIILNMSFNFLHCARMELAYYHVLEREQFSCSFHLKNYIPTLTPQFWECKSNDNPLSSKIVWWLKVVISAEGKVRRF